MIRLRPVDVAASTRTLPIRLVGVLLCLGIGSFAGAASLSLVPTTSVTDVKPGDTVTFDIRIDFTGDPTIGGSFDIFFDPDALQFVGFSSSGVGSPTFHRDPDILAGSLKDWCDGDFNGLPVIATLGNVTFEVLPTMGAATNITAAEASGSCGPWFSAVTFQQQLVTYNGFSVEALDTDGDGNPNHSDPDDDNDGIGDALDTDPVVANNLCTTRVGDVATVAEMITGTRTCAAKVSVDVEGPTKVMGGDLTVISPLIRVHDGVEVDGEMTAINADPCPGC